MPKRTPFVHKLLKNLGRVDPDALQNHLLAFAAENSLYSEALEELGEGVLLATREGRMLFANRQARDWLALNPSDREAPLLSEALPDSEIRQFILQHLENLREKAVGDFGLLSPRELALRVSLIPLEVDSTQSHTLILLTDTAPASAPTLLDEKLTRIESMLRLAGGVAHEIGNPLNSIGIHLTLLKKHLKDLPPGKRKSFESALSVLNAETARLDKIIRNFLKATRKPPLRFRPEDLNDILEEALRFLSPELEQAKVRLDFQPDSNLPRFLADRERLYQAFLNLIKNAMEAMPGGGNLKISVSHKDKLAQIKFRDEGTGISDADLPHLFEPYFTTKEEGSGLGLTIVYDTLREHGGQIEVASRVGKGTTFTLLLPIRQPKLQLPQYKIK